MSDIDPSASPAHLLGAAIRHWRQDVRGMGLRALADEIHWSFSLVGKWERGEFTPDPSAIRQLDTVLGAGGYLIALAALVADMQRLRKLEENARSPEDEMLRRQLLQLAAAGLGAGALNPGESVRQLLAQLVTGASRSVEDWMLACADHLWALRTLPVADVREDLLIDLIAVQHQLQGASAAEALELRRVVAALSVLHGNVLTRLGEHRSAIRWWRMARDAADAAGDRELLLAVYATEIGHGNYGQRGPESLLLLVQQAQRMAGSRPSLGAALVTCSQAKVLTLLGRHGEAQDTLNTYRDLVEADPTGPGIMSGYWRHGQLPFAESFVCAGAGDEPGFYKALEQVLDLNGDHQYSSIVRLHEAQCMIVKGGVDQGTRYAAEVIDALPAGQRNHMIVETGRMVLKAVPSGQLDRPHARELRALTI